jgi:hypothetical protein
MTSVPTVEMSQTKPPEASRPSTASQQLFEAFQFAPTQQSQQTVKNSILSLYGNNPVQKNSDLSGPTEKIVPQVSQPMFANFSALSVSQKPNTSNGNQIGFQSGIPSFANFPLPVSTPQRNPESTTSFSDSTQTASIPDNVVGKEKVGMDVNSSNSFANFTKPVAFDTIGSIEPTPKNSASFGSFSFSTAAVGPQTGSEDFGDFTSSNKTLSSAPTNGFVSVHTSSLPGEVMHTTSFATSSPYTATQEASSTPLRNSIAPVVHTSPSLSFNGFASTSQPANFNLHASPIPMNNGFAQSTSSVQFETPSTGVLEREPPTSPVFHTPFSSVPPKNDPFGDIATFGASTKPIAPPANIDHWSDFQ